MIKNFLKLSRCLAMAAHAGISEAAHVDRIESSEEGGAICGARNSKVVRSGGLRHFERFCWIALVESFECPQRRQGTELDRRILRVPLFEFRRDLVGSRGVVQKRQRKGGSIVGVPASVKRQRRYRAPLRLRANPE